MWLLFILILNRLYAASKRSISGACDGAPPSDGSRTHQLFLWPDDGFGIVFALHVEQVLR